MANHISTHDLEPSEYELWDRFVETTRLGTIYSQSFFLRPLSQAFGTKFRILGAFKGDELVGGIGIHYQPSRFGDMIQIRPLLYYNGLVISNFESKYPSITSSRQMEVVNALLDDLERRNYASAELCSTYPLQDFRPFLGRGWRIWHRYTYLVPIADLKEQWEHAEQNIRRLITRCEREGMQLELSDDVDAFYELNRSTYLRKGVQPYVSREGFSQLHKALKGCSACQIYFAVTPEGKRAAGQIVLFSKHPTTHTWMAGSDPQFLQSGASAFLRWKVFEDLNRRGYQYNDLTDAMNEMVARFKSQFGGALQPSFVLYKEFSSRLRLQNRIKSLTSRPLEIVRSKLSKSSTATFDE